MQFRILCVHIETSSLWAEFVNMNRCISVHPRRIKVFNFVNFDNSHNSFLWPEYLIDYFCENGFHVRLWHPYCVFYFSAQRQYTAVQKITFLALEPFVGGSIYSIKYIVTIVKCEQCNIIPLSSKNKNVNNILKLRS